MHLTIREKYSQAYSQVLHKECVMKHNEEM